MRSRTGDRHRHRRNPTLGGWENTPSHRPRLRYVAGCWPWVARRCTALPPRKRGMAATNLADSWSADQPEAEGCTKPDCRLHSW